MWKRRTGGVTLYRVEPATLADLGQGDVFVLQRQLNEVGYSLCRAPSGALVRGPMAEGTPTRVQIPIACPPGTTFEGLNHTHPGGVAFPSSMDIKSGIRVGAKVLCIDADGDRKCFRLKRR